MKRKNKMLFTRIIAVVLSLALACFPVDTVKVSASENGEVSYLSPMDSGEGDGSLKLENGQLEFEELSCAVYNVVDGSTTVWDGSENECWYVVKDEIEVEQRIKVTGHVKLILCDGCELTAENGISVISDVDESGIEQNSLTIYAQSTGENQGKLIVGGADSYAAIGGESGVEKPGASNSAPITINGGTVIANGGINGAGIGGGRSGDGSNITINGGNVTATGGDNGAGIGGGNNGAGSNITINGGNVTATGGDNGAGIGGGNNGDRENVCSGSNITINGGIVNATGGKCGAGIGGGSYGNASDIIITDGIVTAIGGGTEDVEPGSDGATVSAIGAGCFRDLPNNIFIRSYKCYAGDSQDDADYLGEEEITVEELKDKLYVLSVGHIAYLQPDLSDNTKVEFEAVTCSKYDIVDSSADAWSQSEDNDGWYVVLGNVEISDRITVTGHVNLILCDGCDLTAEKGISVISDMDESGNEKNSLTIYAQSTGENQGKLIAGDSVPDYYAAIGGANGYTSYDGQEGAGNSAPITINGGTVEAYGGKNAAGIGGGLYGNGSYITINGGTVTATGGEYGAGIGGGTGGEGSYIMITGGAVTATGGRFAAGIGGGDDGVGSYIMISSGDVTATGGEKGAGIGGGKRRAGSNITINSGTVKAYGGYAGAGIGGGTGGEGSYIMISGGDVTATGDENAAGIGSGRYGDEATEIHIKDSIVKAGADENGAEPVDSADITEEQLAGATFVSIIPIPQIVLTDSMYTETYEPEKTFKIDAKALYSDGSLGYTVENDASDVISVDESGNVTVLGAGTANIRISLAATDKCVAAESKTVAVTIVKGSSEISVPNPNPINKTVGDAAFKLEATTTAKEGTLKYSSSAEGVATVAADGTVTVVGAGEAVITVSMDATANYNAAADKTVKITVAKASAEISAPEKAEKTFGDAAFKLEATTTAKEGTLKYSSSAEGVATVAADGTVTIVGAGEAVITVSMDATANYNAAADKTVKITVAKAGAEISAPEKAEKTFGDAAFKLEATTTAKEGTLKYSSNAEGVATVAADGTVTIVGAGTATITVSLESKNYTAESKNVTVTVVDRKQEESGNNQSESGSQSESGNNQSESGSQSESGNNHSESGSQSESGNNQSESGSQSESGNNQSESGSQSSTSTSTGSNGGGQSSTVIPVATIISENGQKIPGKETNTGKDENAGKDENTGKDENAGKDENTGKDTNTEKDTVSGNGTDATIQKPLSKKKLNNLISKEEKKVAETFVGTSSFVASVSNSAAEAEGAKWSKKKGTYIDSETKKMVTNSFVKLNNGSVKFVGETGTAVKSSIIVAINPISGEKDSYCTDKKGNVAMGKAVKLPGGEKVFAKEDGILAKKEMVTDKNGNNFYADKNGLLVTKQLVKVDKNKYYFDKNGKVVKNSFVNIDGKQYYTNDKGEIVKDCIFSVDTNDYYANAYGVIVKNQVITDKNGQDHACKEDGTLGRLEWVKIGDKEYWCNVDTIIMKYNIVK